MLNFRILHSLQHSAFSIQHGLALLAVVTTAATAAPETLRSVGGLPAHIAGRFTELTVCRQAPDGSFLVFDRRSHTVFGVAPGAEAPREIIQIGAEPGRILRPYAFDVAANGTFVVADAPQGRGRVQVFMPSGSRLAGFALPGREVARVTFDGVVISGLGSLVYDGRSIFVSRPEAGSLITELGIDGVSARTFGELRATGHESDKALHVALNSGLVVLNPDGGFYYVFAAGVPAFRKYNAAGVMLFERHIEGAELDEYMRTRPTTWPTRATAEGEAPLVRPIVRAAAADAAGRLWVALDVPYTYVYDRHGDKTRVLQLRATGLLAPTNLSFTSNNRLVVTPGCFVFDARLPADRKAP